MQRTTLTENTELTKRHFACRVYHSYFHYLRTHFPEIDLESLCLKAGLPLSYLMVESNWVSVTFDRRFTELCIEATGQSDLCYRVGGQAVSPEVMGIAVNFILKSTFSIRWIFNALPKLTSVFSKVTEVSIVRKGQTFVDLRLRVAAQDLNEVEREALKANLPNIVQNTIGHYEALPTIHKKSPARITYAENTVDKSFPEYVIHVDFQKSVARSRRMWLVLFAGFLAVAAKEATLWTASKEQGLQLALGFSLIGWAALVYRYMLVRKGLGETVDSLRDLDQRYQSLQEAKEYAQTLSKSYSRFVPWDFLRSLERSSITDVKFGDHVEREMTILFADLRGFTKQAEGWTPKETFNFLNAHLERMAPIIREHGGFIDKYIGDCIMAVFPSSAESAVRAAIKMVECSNDYNFERAKTGRKPLKLGIGINTGRVVFGTVGYSEYMQGTVVSDSVNLASRFEGLAKKLDVSIIIGEATMMQIQDTSNLHCRPLGLIEVRGRDEQEYVYQVHTSANESVAPRFTPAKGDVKLVS